MKALTKQCYGCVLWAYGHCLYRATYNVEPNIVGDECKNPQKENRE